MRRISFTRRNRSDNLLHIETDGAIINIRVGLTDLDNNPITRVDVIPDGDQFESPGWIIHPDDRNGVTRVVNTHNPIVRNKRTDRVFVVAHVINGWTPDERSGFFPQYYFNDQEIARETRDLIRDRMNPEHKKEIKLFELEEIP